MASSNQEVFMNVPKVQELVGKFADYANILNGIKQALQIYSGVLKATAWLSFGAGAAEAAYIDNILPNFDKASAKMTELSGDISSAIQMYTTGDTDGSNLFCN